MNQNMLGEIVLFENIEFIVNGHVAPNLVAWSKLKIVKTIANSTLKSHEKDCKWTSCSKSCGMGQKRL